MVARADQTYEFSLYSVSQGTSELDGTWLYLNYTIDRPKKGSVARFDAIKDKIGIVWPNVRLEVRDEQTGQWTLIGKSSQGGKKVAITVAPGSKVDLFVQLDRFKRFIGQCKHGRIVLSNGQASEFELKYLLPPGADSEK